MKWTEITMNNSIKTGVFGVLLFTGGAFGQDPNCVYLEEDIYPGSYGSLPSAFTEYNGALYFSATGNAMGAELWKFEDGITSMVADINPGSFGSLPNEFTVLGSYMYFTANNGVTGKELFRYDGTSVSLVADILPGAGSSLISQLTPVGSVLYFAANNGTNGIEPWKYDGTTASLVADLNPGAGHSNPVDIQGVGTDVYFSAINPVYGLELWKYDGISATVFDINPGALGSDPAELTAFSGNLCFRANDGTSGTELWMCDGTSLTVLDINPTGNSNPFELTVLGSNLIFRGFEFTNGYELWKFDGTAVAMIMDINPGATNSLPANLFALGSYVYFSANDGASGVELWRSDGNTASLAADVRSGSGSSMPVMPDEKFSSLGADLYFVASSATSGYELWKFDGTSAILGRDIVPGGMSPSPSGLKSYDSKLYFMADDGIAGGELWVWNPDADLTSSINVVTCGNYTSPAGDLYTANGAYNFVDTIPSLNCPGCDSLISVDLTISQPFDSITIVACNDYTAPSGTFYNVEGTFQITDVIPSVSCPGVDSTLYIDLTIVDDISTAVVVFSGVILAQQSGAGYQWLDCDNGYAPIAGATDQDFLPASDGNYACQVSLGTCIDTTGCYFVEAGDPGAGIDGVDKSDLVIVYPNPAGNKLSVELKTGTPAMLEVVDINGQKILSALAEKQSVEIDLTLVAPGVYFLVARHDDWIVVKKFIRE